MRKLPAVIALALTALLLASACGDGGDPAASKIAFVSERDGNNEIYVMNADGSGRTRLTNDPAGDGLFGIALSPVS